MFNSLKYAKILEDAGLPRDQAETHIQVISDVLEGELVTKQNYLELKSMTMSTNEVVKLDAKITNEFEKLKAKIEKSEKNIIFKLGSLMIILSGCVIGLLGLILQSLH